MLTRTLLFASVFAVMLPAFSQTPIRITADLTEAPRKLYHAEIDLPVKPGHLTLTTPQWIPGNHRPTGPVEDITGVVFTANGKTLQWRRDDVDLYAFHLDIPAGVTSLHAHLDCIVLARASDKIAVLEWEKLLLYPANLPVAKIAIQPSVTVPAGWGIGTALQPTGNYDPNAKAGGTTEFHATTVEQLEDSPVIAGEYFHEFALAPEVTPKHYLDVVSDEPNDSNLRPEFLQEVSNLVREAGVAYNSRHYNVYHFLLTLSDVAGGEGLEHGQSSDNGVDELAYSDAHHQAGDADLLAHEFTHSWNGKYRRPDKLYQTNFSAPEVGELLWVYEGMTQYMGNVLAARSGLKSQAQYRDNLAASAASLDYKSGRNWRSTDDTALAASVLRSNSPVWSNWRRGQDYYQEGELLWLDADTKIRELTNDQKSLTDFFHLFLAKGGNTGPLIVTYNRAEIIADLNEVVKFDWAGFLHEHVDLTNEHADFAGIERGGYKIVYQDHPSDTEHMGAGNRRFSGPNVWYSLGLRLNAEGVIYDVRWGGPADKAKLAPGQKLIAVNGHVLSTDSLHEALVAAKSNTEPIHFLMQTESYIKPIDVDYHDGERFPAMVRVDGTKDYLDEITSPLTKAPAGDAASK
ncbi:M61 family metallopeptidase [Granulicella mallensis]|uniref:Putative metalloprotease with PDZ domain n=1 Tax=Granulicella mallensis TaxID=940614 RepID=A0A7W8E961_9BACT|nr:M61 family metallopeptidase [Granulicella mallensis]MBB5064143.1 putative metalloprotease with PDZ domain [Granulicella mallensis]